MELALSPGMTDETVQLVVVDVDLDAPENRNPTQMLEDSENIVVKRIPLASLAQERRFCVVCVAIRNLCVQVPHRRL